MSYLKSYDSFCMQIMNCFQETAKGKIMVQSVASLFSEAIRRIHNEESISILFDAPKSKK